jgi:hypothetical protein
MDLIDETLSEFEDSPVTHELFLENVLFVLPSLTEAEQQIVRLRSGLSDGMAKSRDYISRELKISESAIKEAESALIVAIKNDLGSFELPDIFRRQGITVLQVIRAISSMNSSEEKEVLKRKLGLFDGRFWTDLAVEKDLGCSSARSEELVRKLLNSLKMK